MAFERVIARASRSEPLDRVVVSADERVAYLSRADLTDAVASGATGPIGFPRSDVFRYDDDLYHRLREQWEREGRTDDRLWAEAEPYVPTV